MAEQDLLTYYPVGKRVRSVMHFNTTGEGINRDWFLTAEAHFAYQHRVALESKVVANNGRRLVAELLIGEVAEVRAVTEQAIELRVPDNPIVPVVWKELEDQLLRPVPGYAVVRRIAELIYVLDPRLRRTLTWFHDQLRELGLPVPDASTIELTAKLDKLSGSRLQVEYVSGLGVTRIRVLDGQRFDADDLMRLAYNLSMLVDYYLFPALDAEPDHQWEVRAQDVAGLMNVGYYGQLHGTLKLRRGNNRITPEGETQAVLHLVDGEVRFGGELPRELGAARGLDATLVPRAGTIHYSPEDWLVREARLRWDATHVRFSTDHLLFGTERVRNLRVETYYEAQRVDGSEEDAD